MGVIWDIFHSSGILFCVRQILKRSVIVGASSSAHSLKTRASMSTLPGDDFELIFRRRSFTSILDVKPKSNYLSWPCSIRFFKKIDVSKNLSTYEIQQTSERKLYLFRIDAKKFEKALTRSCEEWILFSLFERIETLIFCFSFGLRNGLSFRQNDFVDWELSQTKSL